MARRRKRREKRKRRRKGREKGRRRRDGAQCLNYNVSLLVPRNGPLPGILNHAHPLPPVQMSKRNLCPKRRES